MEGFKVEDRVEFLWTRWWGSAWGHLLTLLRFWTPVPTLNEGTISHVPVL